MTTASWGVLTQKGIKNGDHINIVVKVFGVSRTIRNLSEDFVNLLSKFKHWIHGKMEKWRVWFNDKRYPLGVKNYSGNLYVKLKGLLPDVGKV